MVSIHFEIISQDVSFGERYFNILIISAWLKWQWNSSSGSVKLPDLSKNRTARKSAIEQQLVGWPLFDAFVIFIERILSLLAASYNPWISWSSLSLTFLEVEPLLVEVLDFLPLLVYIVDGIFVDMEEGVGLNVFLPTFYFVWGINFFEFLWC